MGPTWGPSVADKNQVGPMLAHELCYLGQPRILLSWRSHGINNHAIDIITEDCFRFNTSKFIISTNSCKDCLITQHWTFTINPATASFPICKIALTSLFWKKNNCRKYKWQIWNMFLSMNTIFAFIVPLFSYSIHTHTCKHRFNTQHIMTCNLEDFPMHVWQYSRVCISLSIDLKQ